MKIGADDRKKVVFTGILLLAAIALFVSMVFANRGAATASGPSATAVQPDATPAATESTRGARKTAIKSQLGRGLDPSLQIEFLQASENTAYEGTGRNPFKSVPDPPLPPPKRTCSPLGGKSDGLRWCDAVIVPERPAPPPIDLKFFGFASKAGELKVFLMRGQDLFIAKEGDLVDRRYKIVEIRASSVMIHDVLNDNTQEILLTRATT